MNAFMISLREGICSETGFHLEPSAAFLDMFRHDTTALMLPPFFVLSACFNLSLFAGSVPCLEVV